MVTDHQTSDKECCNGHRPPDQREGVLQRSQTTSPVGRSVVVVTDHQISEECCSVVVERFYIALFSALEQTHSAHM